MQLYEAPRAHRNTFALPGEGAPPVDSVVLFLLVGLAFCAALVLVLWLVRSGRLRRSFVAIAFAVARLLDRFNLSAAICLIPAIALLLALLPWPYSYYFGLRVLVTGAALFIAVSEHRSLAGSNAAIAVFLMIALVFNPVVPAKLTKEWWMVLNLLACAAFFWRFRLGPRRAVRRPSEDPGFRALPRP